MLVITLPIWISEIILSLKNHIFSPCFLLPSSPQQIQLHLVLYIIRKSKDALSFHIEWGIAHLVDIETTQVWFAALFQIIYSQWLLAWSPYPGNPTPALTRARVQC